MRKADTIRFFMLALGVLLLAAGQTTQLSAAEPSCADCTYTKAYDAAEVYGVNPTRGIILHLHDCRGLDVDSGWQREWLDYLNLSGFVVVAIDSFADVRPLPVACPKDPWLYLYRKVLIYRARVGQADYAAMKIREKYPGQRIFVWGHSEGGVTAQLMTAEIDGLISTGAPCSTEWLEGIAQIPLLVIQGTGDAILQEAKEGGLYRSLDDRCKINMTEPKWEWLTVEGMGHAAELSQKDVKRRITKFLGIPHDQ